jgi:mRNA-degrading endonuclease RelE of RelBE toxin-antitoxin system
VKYRIEIAEGALEDLRWFKKAERVTILDSLARHLEHEAVQQSRDRKKLRESILSQWELRIDQYRVFYNVIHAERKVQVTAVGRKDRNRLLIRGREVKL